MVWPYSRCRQFSAAVCHLHAARRRQLTPRTVPPQKHSSMNNLLFSFIPPFPQIAPGVNMDATRGQIPGSRKVEIPGSFPPAYTDKLTKTEKHKRRHAEAAGSQSGTTLAAASHRHTSADASHGPTPSTHPHRGKPSVAHPTRRIPHGKSECLVMEGWGDWNQGFGRREGPSSDLHHAGGV